MPDQGRSDPVMQLGSDPDDFMEAYSARLEPGDPLADFS